MMIGARKKTDGRDGQQDVRARRELPRDDRRGRPDSPKQPAVEGHKGATLAGAAVSTAGRTPSPQGLKSSPVVSSHVLRRLIDFTIQTLLAFSPQVASSLRSAAGPLARPGVQIVLVLVGATAAFGAAARVVATGLDRDAGLAALVAAVALSCAGLPHLCGTQRWRLPDALRRFLDAKGVSRGRMMAIAVLFGLAGAGAWLRWGRGPQVGRLASPAVSSGKVVEGRLTALTGDTVRVGGTMVRLAGIEAPERDQECTRPGNRRWRCGEAATQALSRSVRGAGVRCEIGRRDSAGRALGTCYAHGKDIAAILVRDGHVFSSGGWFASYGSLERQARAHKAGLWLGEAERPSEYRSKIWDAAKRAAPGGCPIKGQVSAAGKIYVLPWSPDYQRIRPRTAKGERWFCSEEEAQTAGWKPARRG
ncbi:MAG TPA: thermonuclease family protein [Hyphomicrobiaceae bacterium]|nr:thermonuclease family protein [Hyphomicrobiaceae bacterium]